MARPDFGLLRNFVAIQTPSFDASADSPNIVRDGAGNISGYNFTFRAESGFAGLKPRSEEHTSELQSLMRISYAVFCLKKKKKTINNKSHNHITHNQITHQMTLQYTII